MGAPPFETPGEDGLAAVEFTTEEAARWLGISRSTFVRWADAGRIPFEVGPDGDRRFRREDLEAVAVRINRDPEAEE